jgi:hypothetical protein
MTQRVKHTRHGGPMICISSDDAGDSTHQLDFMTWKLRAG